MQLKAGVDLRNDLGLGDFGLWYMRDKDGREADFLVSRDGRPWIVVEVKKSDTSTAAGFRHMAKALGAPHNFQMVLDQPEVGADPFAAGADPLIVQARSLLRWWKPPVE